jgi:hypothetical protein
MFQPFISSKPQTAASLLHSTPALTIGSPTEGIWFRFTYQHRHRLRSTSILQIKLVRDVDLFLYRCLDLSSVSFVIHAIFIQHWVADAIDLVHNQMPSALLILNHALEAFRALFHDKYSVPFLPRGSCRQPFWSWLRAVGAFDLLHR